MSDPNHITPEQIARLESEFPLERRFEFLDKVPTVPGLYVDKTNGIWLRSEDGQWYDAHGHTEDRSLNWVLGNNDLVPLKLITGDEG